MDFSILLTLAAGILAGGAVVIFLLRIQSRTQERSMEEMKNAFSALSSESLKQSGDQFLQLASEVFKSQLEKGEGSLEEKKKLIDANLKNMVDILDNLRKQSTTLSTQLAENQKETHKLRSTAEDLRNVLSSSQARGQWGERMVVDILNLLGMVENVNYTQQKQIESGEKPDFTFYLPKGKKVNMDVKFPLAHYERFIAAEIEIEMEQEKKQFLSDVKNHINTVAKRGYIDPVNNTVDYVLIFIPNESIYAFIHKHEPELSKYALEKHIVLCSPITLYAILSLIHQAVSTFSMEEKAGQIVNLLSDFQTQWEKFIASMDKMGKRIDDAKKEYDGLVSTRTRALEKPLNKIKEIELKSDGIKKLGD